MIARGRLARDIEHDFAAGVAACQDPVCLSRGREREHVADDRLQRAPVEQCCQRLPRSRLPAGRPSRASTRYAVPAASGVAAASANEIAELIGAARSASVTASSAYPPAPSGKCVIAMTLSPGARPVTPGPTLSTIPATS